MTRALCLAAVLMGVLPFGFAACGGNLRPPDPIPDKDVGEWYGHFTFSMEGEGPRSYDGSITLKQNSTEARTVDVSGLCPDGSGTIIAAGFDSTYAWDGEFECQNPTYLNMCPITLRYTSVRVSVVENVMTMHASGTALSAACEKNVPTTLDFVCERRSEAP